MIKIEYKKINYIFSVNSCIEENIKKLSLTDESKLFISKLISVYNDKIKNNINSYKLGLSDKKKLLEQFNESIPKELMILRNHIKSCCYCNNVSEFNFKYKTLEEDFKRLLLIR